MWNAISLVQELNSYRRVHILWRYLLHHGHLSSRIDNTDSLDFFSSSTPLVHRSRRLLQTASSVRIELMHVSLCWSANVSVSMWERRSWVRAWLSISVSHVFSVLLEWSVRWEVSGRTPAVFWVVAFRICSKQHAEFFGISTRIFLEEFSPGCSITQ